MPRIKGKAKEPSTESMAATAVETESKPTSSLMNATIRMYPFHLAFANLATSELVKSKLAPSRRTTLELWDVMRKPMRLSTECFAESKVCVFFFNNKRCNTEGLSLVMERCSSHETCFHAPARNKTHKKRLGRGRSHTT